MVSKKGKRRIEYNGAVHYWYIRIGDNGHRVHILSSDKKVYLEYPFFDTELSITPQIIRTYLKNYYDSLTEA